MSEHLSIFKFYLFLLPIQNIWAKCYYFAIFSKKSALFSDTSYQNGFSY